MGALKGIISNTVFLTVISGVLVFVLSQLAMEFIIKPLTRYNSIKAKIAYNLVYYGNVYLNPIDSSKFNDTKDLPLRYSEASDCLRKLAAEIAGFAEERSVLRLFVRVKRIKDVYSALMGISNGCTGIHIDYLVKDNEEKEKLIKSKLHLKSI